MSKAYIKSGEIMACNSIPYPLSQDSCAISVSEAALVSFDLHLEAMHLLIIVLILALSFPYQGYRKRLFVHLSYFNLGTYHKPINKVSWKKARKGLLLIIK